ncbi:type II toxin-antitoxin system HicA family toxin [Lichenibacterium ramalinae]|uniref:Type II toxin-antitoxin system HicA family toxin n=1 Tax=Lichenibacterium ramalinae TaxID=2316527 RepID=A0A4Q2R522_9HYPH|nr:type II toxin-antitoxin system HicA family toxin [Lichenibacterium ramalinae]
MLTYREFIEILSRHGFTLHRHDDGSHQRWRAEKDGRPILVTVAAHGMNDTIPPGTLASMVRQSELGSSAFRK